MKTDEHDTATPDPEPSRPTGWFATFTFLDFSSVISSSQWQRLLALMRKLWRRTAAAV
jgi:hypothetical protein